MSKQEKMRESKQLGVPKFHHVEQNSDAAEIVNIGRFIHE